MTQQTPMDYIHARISIDKISQATKKFNTKFIRKIFFFKGHIIFNERLLPIIKVNYAAPAARALRSNDQQSPAALELLRADAGRVFTGSAANVCGLRSRSGVFSVLGSNLRCDRNDRA